MTDPATLRPGDTVLVRAIVDRAPVGSAIEIHVGNSRATVVPSDIASTELRVRYGACRSLEADVLVEHGQWLVLDTAPMPIVLHRDWCEQV